MIENVTRTSSILQIRDDGFHFKTVEVTPRIGIRRAADLPLRLFWREEPHQNYALNKARIQAHRNAIMRE